MLPIGIEEGQRRIPWISILLALSNVGIFIFACLQPNFESMKVRWSFMPHFGDLASLFSHMFMHDNAMHLLMNLIFFILPGMKLEDALGSFKFLAFYLACGVAANAVHVIMAGSLSIPMIGASGAISGIVGGFMVLYPTCRMRLMILPPLPLFLTLPAWVFLGYYFGAEVMKAYVSHVQEAESTVALWAHIGGFAFGAASLWSFFGWNQGIWIEKG